MLRDWPLALCPDRGQKCQAQGQSGSWEQGVRWEHHPVLLCLLCPRAVDTDCRVEAHPCERRTLETIRELADSALCWRGSRQADAVLAVPCPFYRFVHVVWGQRHWGTWVGVEAPAPRPPQLQESCAWRPGAWRSGGCDRGTEGARMEHWGTWGAWLPVSICQSQEHSPGCVGWLGGGLQLETGSPWRALRRMWHWVQT